MKTILVLFLLGCLGFWFFRTKPVEKTSFHHINIQDMKLKITFSDTELSATIYDNPTARDFVSLLPLTIELEDYANTEKIFYPERKLMSEGAPNGYQPSKGDITYYVPWGDVAIFYKDFGPASGLISLGSIDGNGIDLLKKVGKEQVTFELISD